jgi:hypothetical protein
MEETTIKNLLQINAATILRALAEQPRPEGGNAEVTGTRLTEITGLLPNKINDAITILIEAGFVEWLQTLGTGPYDFLVVWITARGRYEIERIEHRPEVAMDKGVKIIRPPSPVGSPFGFTDMDWEIVADRKSRKDTLFVVLGYHFVSDFYDSEPLIANIQAMFEAAITEYNQIPISYHVKLDFHALRAGYGEHLFNEIARDIISADIAVFETSDLNPNVMVELGVALTWDVRVLPIKKEGQRIPPSDISGQTWADYRDNAIDFVDPDHSRKLVRMIERAARKKGHI